jgi:hypothetical protein
MSQIMNVVRFERKIIRHLGRGVLALVLAVGCGGWTTARLTTDQVAAPAPSVGEAAPKSNAPGCDAGSQDPGTAGNTTGSAAGSACAQGPGALRSGAGQNPNIGDRPRRRNNRNAPRDKDRPDAPHFSARPCMGYPGHACI